MGKIETASLLFSGDPKLFDGSGDYVEEFLDYGSLINGVYHRPMTNRFGQVIDNFDEIIEAAKKKKSKPDKPPSYRDEVTLRDLQEAADRKITELEILWQEERIKLEAFVQDALKNKSTPPPNYWEAEHRARRLYEAAVRLRGNLK